MLDTFLSFSIPLLVALNGVFVAIEFSLVSVRWTRIEQLVDQNVLGAKTAQRAIESLNDSLAACQLGITFTSLALGWVGEPALEHMLEPVFASLPGPWDKAVSHGVAIGVAFLTITYLHIVLGELVPRAIALQHAERVVLLLSPALLAFRAVTRPLVAFMRGSGGVVMRLLRVPEPRPETQVHSADEIDLLIAEGTEAGVIQPDEATYARAVFELSDRTVGEIMVPRERVVMLSLNASEEDVLDTARESAHTRMPVWEGTMDNVVGIVNTKDLFHLFSLRGLVILMDAMYPAMFVRPDLALGKLLLRFRKERRQMAVVHDEAGRFLGIVTLEDILEEIVGEIEDEHDCRRGVAPPGAARCAGMDSWATRNLGRLRAGIACRHCHPPAGETSLIPYRTPGVA